mgnify:CR=1 FL=1
MAEDSPQAFREVLADYGAISIRQTLLERLGHPDTDASNELHCLLGDKLLQAPAGTGSDLGIKLDMIEERYLIDHGTIPYVDWQALRRDIDRLVARS